MAALTKKHTFTQGVASDAPKVNENFNDIVTHINSHLVHKDGSVAMTGPLTLAGAPASASQAATKAYVDALVAGGEMTGVIKMWGGSVNPTGYRTCNGEAISRVVFSALFAVIGTSFGAGDGSTTFNVPDLRNRVPRGVQSGAPGATGGSDTTLPTGVTFAMQVLAGSTSMPQVGHTHSAVPAHQQVHFIIKT